MKTGKVSSFMSTERLSGSGLLWLNDFKRTSEWRPTATYCKFTGSAKEILAFVKAKLPLFRANENIMGGGRVDKLNSILWYDNEIWRGY